jgi:hypothetical protein
MFITAVGMLIYFRLHGWLGGAHSWAPPRDEQGGK